MTLTRTDRLPDCYMCYRRVERCDRCQRLHAVGLLTDALVMLPVAIRPGQGLVPGPAYLDCLDAVACLLQLHAKQRQLHQKELRDEQLGAQRDARAAYDEGRQVGRQDSNF